MLGEPMSPPRSDLFSLLTSSFLIHFPQVSFSRNQLYVFCLLSDSSLSTLKTSGALYPLFSLLSTMSSHDDDIHMSNPVLPDSSSTEPSSNSTQVEPLLQASESTPSASADIVSIPADNTLPSATLSMAVHNPSAKDLQNAFLARVHGDAEIYESSVDNLLNLPVQTVLAFATYKTDFHRTPQPFTGNLIYISSDHQGEFETILIGEILPEAKGTKLSAKGTHYPRTPAKV